MVKFIIGIDPGRDTGICVYNRQTKRIHELLTHDFWDTIAFLDCFRKYMGAHMTDEDAFNLIIEDPGQNSFMYNRHTKKNDIKSIIKIAQNVGGNKEDGYLFIEYAKKKKYSYKAVKPIPESMKWNERQFKIYSSYVGKSNQHERDAAKLCIGL